jgi:hypothetical protein
MKLAIVMRATAKQAGFGCVYAAASHDIRERQTRSGTEIAVGALQGKDRADFDCELSVT